MPHQETQTPPVSTNSVCCGADLQLFSNGEDENMYEGKDKAGEVETGQTSTDKMEEIDEYINACLRVLRLD